MGYDLHITRRAHWSDRGDDIGFEEWEALVAADPELKLEGFAEADSPSGQRIRIESPGLTAWRPGDGRRIVTWFDLRRGEVSTKNPDARIFAKMWSIAVQLRARIQGDEGEFYGADFHPVAD